MSLSAARIAMRAIASYSTDAEARRLAADALKALEEEGVVDPAPARTRPMTNAERCREWRRNQKRKRATDTKADTPSVSSDMTSDTERHGTDTAVSSVPSRALPSSPSPSSDLSSPRSLSPESLNPEGSEGSTGAGVRGASPAAAPAESGTFSLSPTGSTRRPTRSDTTDTTNRVSRRGPAGTRIPEDWTPSRETVAWAASEFGVDALAVVPEFVDHWRSETGRDALKADWDRALRNRIRKLVQWGEAPKLPPPTPPVLAAGDPAQAASVRAVLSGNALPAILAAKEAETHG